jgi:hypothetical protein
MIKITKNEFVKVDEKIKLHTFYNFHPEAGKQVQLTEKEINYIKRANTQFLKAQKILNQAYLSEG